MTRQHRACDLSRSAAAQIQATREALGMTTADLAAKVGCSTQTVYAIETGRRGLTLDMAERFAEALGAKVRVIFELCGNCGGKPPQGFTCNKCKASTGGEPS